MRLPHPPVRGSSRKRRPSPPATGGRCEPVSRGCVPRPSTPSSEGRWRSDCAARCIAAWRPPFPSGPPRAPRCDAVVLSNARLLPARCATSQAVCSHSPITPAARPWSSACEHRRRPEMEGAELVRSGSRAEQMLIPAREAELTGSTRSPSAPAPASADCARCRARSLCRCRFVSPRHRRSAHRIGRSAQGSR